MQRAAARQAATASPSTSSSPGPSSQPSRPSQYSTPGPSRLALPASVTPETPQAGPSRSLDQTSSIQKQAQLTPTTSISTPAVPAASAASYDQDTLLSRAEEEARWVIPTRRIQMVPGEADADASVVKEEQWTFEPGYMSFLTSSSSETQAGGGRMAFGGFGKAQETEKEDDAQDDMDPAQDEDEAEYETRRSNNVSIDGSSDCSRRLKGRLFRRYPTSNGRRSDHVQAVLIPLRPPYILANEYSSVQLDSTPPSDHPLPRPFQRHPHHLDPVALSAVPIRREPTMSTAEVTKTMGSAIMPGYKHPRTVPSNLEQTSVNLVESAQAAQRSLQNSPRCLPPNDCGPQSHLPGPRLPQSSLADNNPAVFRWRAIPPDLFQLSRHRRSPKVRRNGKREPEPLNLALPSLLNLPVPP